MRRPRPGESVARGARVAGGTWCRCALFCVLLSGAYGRLTRTFPVIVEKLVRKWAPLVFMAPGEKFYPGNVGEFLDKTSPVPHEEHGVQVLEVYDLPRPSPDLAVPVPRQGRGALPWPSPDLAVPVPRQGRGALPWPSPDLAVPVPRQARTVLLQKGRAPKKGSALSRGDLPKGIWSETWSLVTKESVGDLLANSSSFLYGRNPKLYPVQVYALIGLCDKLPADQDNNSLSNHISTSSSSSSSSPPSYPSFHVTYWMFYPYNQGKAMCTVDMGRFGAWPIPKVNNFCLGAVKEFGNHVGDWEHMSLYFQGSPFPVKMYVSSHDVGAIYRYDRGQFLFESREIRKGILQRPTFPPVIKLSTPGHRPVLFAAKGSHGLWAAPGKHRFVRIPRLYDTSGYGVPWQTWKSLVLLQPNSPTDRNWLRYRGRWGNPKTKCHPVSSLGINICELSDGPTGIPAKKQHFKCS